MAADPEQEAIARTFDGFEHGYRDAVTASIGVPGVGAERFVQAKADYILDCAAAHFGALDRIGPVLDLGCGIGLYHDLLAPPLASLIGADVSQACLKQAGKLHEQVAYLAYDGSRLPLADGSVDLVYAVCVLHHVPVANWELFVAEVHRVLRPGGLFLLFEHNPFNPVTRRIVNNCKFDEDAVLVTPRRARELLSGSGFGTIRLRHILTCPLIGDFWRRVDQVFGRLPFGAQYYAAGVR